MLHLYIMNDNITVQLIYTYNHQYYISDLVPFQEILIFFVHITYCSRIPQHCR